MDPLTMCGIVAACFCVSYAACWIALSQYHQSVLAPEVAIIQSLITDVRVQIIPLMESVITDYHEDRLLPSMSLLASQRSLPLEPPPQELPEDLKRQIRPQLKEDQIDNIWDKVKASY